MEKLLSERIRDLERQIVVLVGELRQAHLSGQQRSEREVDLANAKIALGLFRKASDFEQKIRFKPEE